MYQTMLRLTSLLLFFALVGFLLVGGFLATGHAGLGGKSAIFIYFLLVFIVVVKIIKR